MRLHNEAFEAINLTIEADLERLGCYITQRIILPLYCTWKNKKCKAKSDYFFHAQERGKIICSAVQKW